MPDNQEIEKSDPIATEQDIRIEKLDVEKQQLLNSKNKLDKARHRSIELFSEKLELKKAYNQIKGQKKEIEAKNLLLKKAISKAKKRTIELFGKHIDLKKASKRIEFQNELIESKNKLLEQKNREIEDSLSYAKLIQEAILPSRKFFKMKFPESFILFKPKEVVSGDFYWYSEHGSKQFFALADCTGHGVPGALMSMIGNSLLNKIVNDNKNFTPSKILKLLNKEVVYTLNQSFDIDSSQNDGMDITLCQFDTEKKEIVIASATQNCYVVSDGKLKVVKGDIFSIGGLFANHPDLDFVDYKFKFRNATTIYLFSDGYQDQFGGPKDKKFMGNKLKSLLLENSKLSMNMQQNMLEEEFEKWKGKNKQIDDVSVVGIRIH